MMRRIGIIVIIGVSASMFIYGTASFGLFMRALDQENARLATPIEIRHRDSIIAFGAVGDIVPGNKNRTSLFDAIIPFSTSPDIMIGNLEGTLTEATASKCEILTSHCFAFKGNPSWTQTLANAGFDVLNTANNHSYDFGVAGNSETKKLIETVGMKASGAKGEITTVVSHGKKIGIVGFSSYEWTNQFFDMNQVTEIIRDVKLHHDIVIVLFHGGREGRGAEFVPIGEEWYYGENRGDLMLFSHTAIDAGADMVIGSGPHILRGMELYNGKLIAYSLGNFASDDPLALTNGILGDSLILFPTLGTDGHLKHVSILPIKLENGVPYPAPSAISKIIIDNLNALSQKNFGDTAIFFDDLGNMKK